MLVLPVYFKVIVDCALLALHWFNITKKHFCPHPGIDYVLTECNGKVTAVAVNIDTHKYIGDAAVRDNFTSFGDGLVVEQNRTLQPAEKFLEAAGNDISDKDMAVLKVSHQNKFACGGLDGMSVRPFVRTALTRSQYFLMSGKTILALDAGGLDNRRIWRIAKKSGINVRSFYL
ncbi:hypothetical protein DPMN_125288 [Dreissena polymorpha]|uniref:Uncharacterized protein n=1 Tax=Dreissena polymorpha TaxID=45954 RepID=A0A9D4GXZ1_DREPO|nr:hypothetical protein DPMN_125288 [Dreissena polymorpha]